MGSIDVAMHIARAAKGMTVVDMGVVSVFRRMFPKEFNGIKMNVCPCGKKFRTASAMMAHMSRCTKYRDMCNLAYMVYRTARYRIIKRVATATKSGKYMCTICGKRFNHMIDAVLHVVDNHIDEVIRRYNGYSNVIIYGNNGHESTGG